MKENLFIEIESLIASIKAQPPISEENQKKLDRKFRLEFNYNSNHIEGNTLTYGETQLLLIFDKTDGTHDFREYQEMKSHDAALKLINEWANDSSFTLTEMHIKQLNALLLVEPFWKEAITDSGQATKRLIEVGQYKKFSNSVRLANGEIFEYVSPIDTPIKMGELMSWYNLTLSQHNMHPIELAALFHYKFVCIHPFDDGNGRVSRLLANYILLKNQLPPIIVKSADKKNYLNALNKADSGDVDSFIVYMASQLKWSLELLLNATKGESIEEDEDWIKELELIKKKENTLPSKRSLQLTNDRLKDSIFPLFCAIENECVDKFKSLFNVCNTDINHHPISDIEKSMINTNVWQMNDIHATDFFPFVTTFLEYKKNFDKPFNVQLQVNIHFYDFEYHVNLFENHSIFITKKIDKILTEKEIKDITNICGKYLLDAIKSSS